MFDEQHHNYSGMDVRILAFNFGRLCLHDRFDSPDEAGQYIATYKQFEHKPPDMIKERLDKDYHAVLRSALTSISKVNKTDVETLRTSLGVGAYF